MPTLNKPKRLIVLPDQWEQPYVNSGKPERCALLCGTVSDSVIDITHVIEVPNRAEDSWLDFVIKKGDAKKALKKHGLTLDDVVGHMHTHPKGSAAHPSYNDVANMPGGYIGLVYHVTTGTVTAYDLTGWLGVLS